jgi:hypothetical protein
MWHGILQALLFLLPEEIGFLKHLRHAKVPVQQCGPPMLNLLLPHFAIAMPVARAACLFVFCACGESSPHYSYV